MSLTDAFVHQKEREGICIICIIGDIVFKGGRLQIHDFVLLLVQLSAVQKFKTATFLGSCSTGSHKWIVGQNSVALLAESGSLMSIIVIGYWVLGNNTFIRSGSCNGHNCDWELGETSMSPVKLEYWVLDIGILIE